MDRTPHILVDIDMDYHMTLLVERLLKLENVLLNDIQLKIIKVKKIDDLLDFSATFVHDTVGKRFQHEQLNLQKA